MNFNNKIERWKLSYDKNITIHKDTYIHPSAIIEVKGGGEIKIAKGVSIHEKVIIQTYGGNIIIGENCSINPNTIIYGHGNTIIGRNVLIAGGCMIIPSNHIFLDKKKTINSQGGDDKTIIIKDDVWIAHGCSILAGVTIEEGCVIAAGAVVNKNTDQYSVYGGVPIKKIKER